MLYRGKMIILHSQMKAVQEYTIGKLHASLFRFQFIIHFSKSQKFFVVVPPLHTPEPYYSSRFPPIHSWFDENTLAVGWGSSIIVMGIEVVKNEIEPTKHGFKRGHILHKFRLDNLRVSIAGISYVQDSTNIRGWKEIVVFGIKVTDQKQNHESDESAVGCYMRILIMILN